MKMLVQLGGGTPTPPSPHPRDTHSSRLSQVKSSFDQYTHALGLLPATQKEGMQGTNLLTWEITKRETDHFP